MKHIIVGKAKIGQTPFSGKVYIGLDIDGSVEVRENQSEAFQFSEKAAALALSSYLTTHHNSQLSYEVETITV